MTCGHAPTSTRRAPRADPPSLALTCPPRRGCHLGCRPPERVGYYEIGQLTRAQERWADYHMRTLAMIEIARVYRGFMGKLRAVRGGGGAGCGALAAMLLLNRLLSG